MNIEFLNLLSHKKEEKGRKKKNMEGVKQTKVKYTHSGHTLRNSFEHQFKY
jgi:hypothetical protein